MDKVKITIYVTTDADPSTLLDAAVEVGQSLNDDLESVWNVEPFDEGEVSVEVV